MSLFGNTGGGSGGLFGGAKPAAGSTPLFGGGASTG